jgi:hypothetical protein
MDGSSLLTNTRSGRTDVRIGDERGNRHRVWARRDTDRSETPFCAEHGARHSSRDVETPRRPRVCGLHAKPGYPPARSLRGRNLA